MDVVHYCLSVSPCHPLEAAFATFRSIVSAVQKSNTVTCKQQLQLLTISIAQLLEVLLNEHRVGRLSTQATSTVALDKLQKYVLSILMDETSES